VYVCDVDKNSVIFIVISYLQALEKEELHQKEAKYILAMDERKRPYNSMFEVKKPTDEEMEAYYMKKRREEDPMAQFMG
jgi:pre-mRNA-processing factor SLU7